MARPLGAENKNKRFKAALVRFADSDPKRLDELAEKLWKTALEGDVSAMREVADRLDGKVPQAIVGDDDHAPVRLEQIQRVIVDPKDTDSEGVSATPGTESL